MQVAIKKPSKVKIENAFDKCLLYMFGLPASLVLIIGDWKTGKTDFALLIAERLLEIGLIKEVASNIKTSDPRIKFVADLPSLREWLFYSDRRKTKLYIFDEAGSHLHRRRSMSRKNIAFVKILPEISKARAKMIAIMQNPESIDKELLSPVWCKGLIIKENKYRAKFISEFFPEEKEVEFFPVPRTTIPFDPYDIADFSLTRPKQIPATIKDEDLKILWEWSVNNKSTRQLDIHPMKLNRIVRKFVKQILEKEYSEQKL